MKWYIYLRKSCLKCVKMCFKTTDEGNDVMKALDMHDALEKHPVKGTVISVNRVNSSVQQLQVKKIKHFSAFHNFTYDSGNIIAWKAYGIGKGKKIPIKSVYTSQQDSTNLEIVKGFSEMYEIPRKVKKKVDKQSSKEELFECKEVGCNLAFQCLEEAEHHMAVGQHKRFVENESVYDTLRREWVSRFTTIDREKILEDKSHVNSDKLSAQSDLPMGWALAKERKGSVRFPLKVKDYLERRFKIGEATGYKANPEQVALDMRNARDVDGIRLFNRDEWLNKSQIKSFFSRMAKGIRNTEWKIQDKNVVLEVNDDVSDDEEEIEREREIAC